MAFKKGISGNPDGRPPGALNKNTKELREMVSNFLVKNFETITQDFEQLEPRERTKLYFNLLQYGLPRPQNVSSEINFENLSEEELNKLVEEVTWVAKFGGDYENT